MDSGTALAPGDLDAFLTDMELTQAQAIARLISRPLARQLAKRLRRLGRQFEDRPRQAAAMKQWLAKLPPSRLSLFAELSAFEGAALLMPQSDAGERDWQTAASIIDVYPGVIPASQDTNARQLLRLRSAAQQRQELAAQDLPLPTGLPRNASSARSPVRRGRRAARRPVTTLPAPDRE
ncbi:hypothetical protein [Streptomyces sp. MI02-7b]|uniref:hypothetical protein n=1 Tax=Streptomyces sp. MI02-7b TaxID=462941 RepID=UPI0029B5EE17|nr:hypothetical protein [Streptomyces sp. MI02-7b]MDX3077867.1 hypothetical protein [Streptomyces sp. MI02-7b]